MNFQSLNKLFLDRAEENSNKPFLWAKINKEWKSLTWKETSEKVKEFSRTSFSYSTKFDFILYNLRYLSFDTS